MKNLFPVLMLGIFVVAFIVACGGSTGTKDGQQVDKIDTSAVIKTATIYTVNLSTIAKILPNIKKDLVEANTILNSTDKLTDKERMVLQQAVAEAKLVIEGFEAISKLDKDQTKAAIAMSQIESYVTTSKAVYLDVSTILESHRSEFTNVQLGKLDATKQKLASLYSAYLAINAQNPDATKVVQIIVDLLSTALQATSSFK